MQTSQKANTHPKSNLSKFLKEVRSHYLMKKVSKVLLYNNILGGYLEYTQNEPCIETYNFAS